MTMPVKYFAPKVTVKLYHYFFLLEITVVKIIYNLNVCSAHSYICIYTHGPGLSTDKFHSQFDIYFTFILIEV